MKRLFQDVVDVLHFLRFVIVRLRQDRCAEMAASLTFTTLLSLVPLLTIMLTVFTAFPVFSDLATSFKSFLLSNLVPETGGRMISRYVEQFAESASRLTALGIAFLGVTAMLLMLTIDNAFHRIFRASRQRRMLQRVLVYWAVITLAPLLVGASLSLTSWLAGLTPGYGGRVSAFGAGVLKLFSIVLTSAAFTLLFRVVPNRYVPISHAMIGGVIAAIAFEAMNRGFAHYITQFPTYKLVYGAFASLPIFLLWIYLSWLMLLFGAIIAAAIPHWRSRHALRIDQAAKLYFALHILKEMDQGMQNGQVHGLPELSRELHLGYEEVEAIMAQLVKAGIVGKLSESGWGLLRSPERIPVSELTRLFLLDVNALPEQPADSEVRQWFARLDKCVAAAQGQTLRDIWQRG
ncbi:YihY family inner membrane protein [Ferrigenium sp. UT5]|uniref:YihY family inner membrane protein n=1 Tax=Ferrigenium sp. UT5 TaxID=3242105 RepID=UPI0038B309B9